MGDRFTVGVLGASGFAGGELVRLLHEHPSFEVVYLGGREAAGRRLGDVHPHLAGLPAGELEVRPVDAVAASEPEVVFSALPHGASAALVPALLEAGCRVVDLAGDFRLDAAAYPVWYGFDHPAPALLDEAVYGLPELFADRIAGASLVANPGCFPTAAVLGCVPVLAAGLADPSNVRVDGKTGVSGAGRAPTDAASFAAGEDSIRPYRFPAHQHTPEIERGIALATGLVVPALFVPHLVPAVRGVVTTSYLTLGSGVTTEELTDCLVAAYDGAPFVRVLPAAAMVDSKRTRGANTIELQAAADSRTGTAVVIGAIDNLVKGAAGQAVQNANLACGFPETTGLSVAGVYP